MKIGDKVTSPHSLWSGDVGTITGIIKRDGDKYGDLIHVLFPENEKHYAYQQSFNSVNLTIQSK